ncbi:MAG: LysR family transcriptional regulator [Gammaproteobacteria bacterium]|nr:LysR family transcriptional regulator [Gammaproteobacteria bacterium]
MAFEGTVFNFRQIQSFVAVYEERSFTRAAERVHATQSGLSMQVGNLEATLELRLFERTAKGVVPTHAGDRLYRRATAILRTLSETEAELKTLSGDISGHICVGLMPTFTYSVLAPALATFMARYPNVDITVIEGYSPMLSAAAARADFDFAIVPVEQGHSGLRAQPFGSDLEVLVSGSASSELPHLAPVRLTDLPPLKLVLPTHGNARRERLETFFTVNSVKIAAILEMDTMSATLEHVAITDWMTVLPATICIKDIDGAVRRLHPITSPQASVDYMLIEPLRRSLSLPATLFMEELRTEFEAQHARWNAVLGKTKALSRPRDSEGKPARRRRRQPVKPPPAR